MTENLLNSLIGLFGTISAISIAYLVLLYDQAQNKIKNHKQYLICEIQNCLTCYKVKESTRFNGGNQLQIELLEKCNHNSISLYSTEILINQLKEDVEKLDSLVERSNNSEAGEKAKLARHIEKYHHNDILSALDNYKDAEGFYSKFPKRSKFGIGVPLSFSALFIILSILKIHLVIDEGYIFSSVIAFFALLGLYLTYHIAIDTLKELRGLDD